MEPEEIGAELAVSTSSGSEEGLVDGRRAGTNISRSPEPDLMVEEVQCPISGVDCGAPN